MNSIEQLDALLEAREFEQVLELYDSLSKDEQADWACRLKYADALRELNKINEALSWYHEIIEEVPGISWCYVGLSKTLLHNNDSVAALEAIKEGLEVCGEEIELLLTQANIFLEQNITDEAVTLFEKVLEQEPTNRWALIGKLSAFIQNKAFFEAVKLAESLYPIIGDDGVVFTKHTEALFNCLQFKEAIPHLDFYRTISNQFRSLTTQFALPYITIVTHNKSPEIIQQTISETSLKLPQSNRYLFKIQATCLTLGAYLSYRLIEPQPEKEKLIGLLTKTYDVFVSSGNVKVFIQYANLLSDLPPSLFTLLFQGQLRSGEIQAAQDTLERINKFDSHAYRKLKLEVLYQQDNLLEVLRSYFDIAKEDNSASLPNTVIYSIVEGAQQIQENTGLIEDIANRLRSQTAASQRLSLPLKVLRASFADITELKSSEFGENVKCVQSFYTKQKRHAEHTQNNPNIPNSIVQFWHTKSKPLQIENACSSWQFEPGYSYKCFSTITAREFISKHLDKDTLTAFDHCALPAEQADFFRLCYLWEKGGIYADCDDILIGNIRPLVQTQSNLVLLKEPFGIGNNIIIAAPKHPVIGAALQRAKASLLTKLQTMTWFKTGPGLLISSLGEYLAWCNENQKLTDVTIFPPGIFKKQLTLHTNYPKKQYVNWTHSMQL